ncbi:MAG: hypothetical protein JWN34_779 [Bryobacterales bacterium]|nr:hypothetical protein [Bryobacterales bacterium]
MGAGAYQFERVVIELSCRIFTDKDAHFLRPDLVCSHMVRRRPGWQLASGYWCPQFFKLDYERWRDEPYGEEAGGRELKLALSRAEAWRHQVVADYESLREAYQLIVYRPVLGPNFAKVRVADLKNRFRS